MAREDQTTREQTLRSRAKEMARPMERPRASASTLSVLEFVIGEERYGIESSWVREVQKVASLTPVPGTRPFILGVISLRGQVLSLVDLRALLHGPTQQDPAKGSAIRISSGEMEFCLGVEGVSGVRSISVEDLKDPPALLADLTPKTIRGVTEEGLQLVDGEVLLNHGELMPPDWKGGDPTP